MTATSPITAIYTLGPTGTNCEAAATEWFRRNGTTGEVKLYNTLEEAAVDMPDSPDVALMGCAVYPDLHWLVFRNLHRFEMIDSLVFPTFDMVLASRDGSMPKLAATHPAPQSLVPEGIEKRLVDSNSQAAAACARGEVDGCITTGRAAENFELKVVKNFGPVPMIFTLHRPLAARQAA